MTAEMFDDNSGDQQKDANAAELLPASQETLKLLLKEVRSRCSARLLQVMGGSGGVSYTRMPDDKPDRLVLHYYGDNDGPTRHDIDGSLQQDDSGRYKYVSDGVYIDTSVQATIFKTDKAEESSPNGKKILTTYKIRKNGQSLEIDRRVRPFELPVLQKIGGRFAVDKNGPPLITAQQRQASAQQEDALGLSSVSESEASDLVELLQTI